MKLKSQPEDFVVDELTDFQVTGGSFAFYRLEKSGLGTPEVAQAISSTWNLPRDAVQHGGLKDRHAQTTQHVTIYRGPQRNLEDRSFVLTYLGQANRHFVAKDIVANRFEITLRGLNSETVQLATERLKNLASGGIINYFDDQRFGSLGISNQFIAQPWCMGDYERALYLAIAEPNVHDRPREKEQKQILRDNWNQWIICKDRLDRSHRRSIVTFLCDHPTNFKRAIALLRPDLRSIYLAAFQSYLWNRWVSNILEAKIPSNQRTTINSLCGDLIVPNASFNQNNANIQLSNWSLPLPSARQKSYPSDTVEYLMPILQDLQMEPHQIRLKFPRDTFFSRGERAVWLEIKDIQHSFQEDEQSSSTHSPKSRLDLHFSLPRGAYATMIVKYLTNQDSPDDQDALLSEEAMELETDTTLKDIEPT